MNKYATNSFNIIKFTSCTYLVFKMYTFYSCEFVIMIILNLLFVFVLFIFMYNIFKNNGPMVRLNNYFIKRNYI